jgi:hypothetical protein
MVEVRIIEEKILLVGFRGDRELVIVEHGLQTRLP